jgi:hypothetical protein
VQSIVVAAGIGVAFSRVGGLEVTRCRCEQALTMRGALCKWQLSDAGPMEIIICEIDPS